MISAPPLSSVSVILPVYNGDRFLRAAIETVLAQTGVQLELIVVNDGSTDGTEEEATGFGARLRYFRTGRSNVSVARNFGIKQARYPNLAFMACDDIWFPDKLAKQAAWLASHPEASVCICRLRYFLHPGFAWPAHLPERLRTGEHTALIPETLFCPRDAFDRVGPFNESMQSAEDADWFARAQEAGLTITERPEVLMKKGVHDRNTSLTGPGIRDDLMRALRESIRRKKSQPQ